MAQGAVAGVGAEAETLSLAGGDRRIPSSALASPSASASSANANANAHASSAPNSRIRPGLLSRAASAAAAAHRAHPYQAGQGHHQHQRNLSIGTGTGAGSLAAVGMDGGEGRRRASADANAHAHAGGAGVMQDASYAPATSAGYLQQQQQQQLQQLQQQRFSARLAEAISGLDLAEQAPYSPSPPASVSAPGTGMRSPGGSAAAHGQRPSLPTTTATTTTTMQQQQQQLSYLQAGQQAPPPPTTMMRTTSSSAPVSRIPSASATPAASFVSLHEPLATATGEERAAAPVLGLGQELGLGAAAGVGMGSMAAAAAAPIAGQSTMSLPHTWASGTATRDQLLPSAAIVSGERRASGGGSGAGQAGTTSEGSSAPASSSGGSKETSPLVPASASFASGSTRSGSIASVNDGSPLPPPGEVTLGRSASGSTGGGSGFGHGHGTRIASSSGSALRNVLDEDDDSDITGSSHQYLAHHASSGHTSPRVSLSTAGLPPSSSVSSLVSPSSAGSSFAVLRSPVAGTSAHSSSAHLGGAGNLSQAAYAYATQQQQLRRNNGASASSSGYTSSGQHSDELRATSGAAGGSGLGGSAGTMSSLERAKSVSSVSSVTSTSSIEAMPFRQAPLGNVRAGYAVQRMTPHYAADPRAGYFNHAALQQLQFQQQQQPAAYAQQPLSPTQAAAQQQYLAQQMPFLDASGIEAGRLGGGGGGGSADPGAPLSAPALGAALMQQQQQQSALYSNFASASEMVVHTPGTDASGPGGYFAPSGPLSPLTEEASSLSTEMRKQPSASGRPRLLPRNTQDEWIYRNAPGLAGGASYGRANPRNVTVGLRGKLVRGAEKLGIKPLVMPSGGTNSLFAPNMAIAGSSSDPAAAATDAQPIPTSAVTNAPLLVPKVQILDDPELLAQVIINPAHPAAAAAAAEYGAAAAAPVMVVSQSEQGVVPVAAPPIVADEYLAQRPVLQSTISADKIMSVQEATRRVTNAAELEGPQSELANSAVAEIEIDQLLKTPTRFMQSFLASDGSINPGSGAAMVPSTLVSTSVQAQQAMPIERPAAMRQLTPAEQVKLDAQSGRATLPDTPELSPGAPDEESERLHGLSAVPTPQPMSMFTTPRASVSLGSGITAAAPIRPDTPENRDAAAAQFGNTPARDSILTINAEASAAGRVAADALNQHRLSGSMGNGRRPPLLRAATVDSMVTHSTNSSGGGSPGVGDQTLIMIPTNNANSAGSDAASTTTAIAMARDLSQSPVQGRHLLPGSPHTTPPFGAVLVRGTQNAFLSTSPFGRPISTASGTSVLSGSSTRTAVELSTSPVHQARANVRTGSVGSTGSEVPNRTARGPSDFDFGEVLGEGSYSTVIKAWDLLSGRRRHSKERLPAQDGSLGRSSAAQAIAGASKPGNSAALREGKKVYAIKVLDKVHILKQKKQKYVGVEKEALSRLIKLPGVVTLYWTFQDRDSLCEYIPILHVSQPAQSSSSMQTLSLSWPRMGSCSALSRSSARWTSPLLATTVHSCWTRSTASTKLGSCTATSNQRTSSWMRRCASASPILAQPRSSLPTLPPPALPLKSSARTALWARPSTSAPSS